jgi:hypothetical protein
VLFGGREVVKPMTHTHTHRQRHIYIYNYWALGLNDIRLRFYQLLFEHHSVNTTYNLTTDPRYSAKQYILIEFPPPGIQFISIKQTQYSKGKVVPVYGMKS